MAHPKTGGSKGAVVKDAGLPGIKRVLATSSPKLDLKNKQVVAALGQVERLAARPKGRFSFRSLDAFAFDATAPVGFGFRI